MNLCVVLIQSFSNLIFLYFLENVCNDCVHADDPSLLPVFSTLLVPAETYTLALSMDAAGKTSYILMTDAGAVLETRVVQHANTCVDNFNEGIVDGLYFGGNCRAPEEVGVLYTS